MISKERIAAEVDYCEKFNVSPPFTWAGLAIPDEVMIPALRNAIARGRALSESEGNQIEHELWPDTFNADGSTVGGILV
ncbi:MAG: hypothetical protein LBD67_09945 [Candidatus Accumulibacter sp.]|jgi:hypothetical protein|nr:hypothetical protein [Accumulibacter sp.]